MRSDPESSAASHKVALPTTKSLGEKQINYTDFVQNIKVQIHRNYFRDI